MKSTTTHTQPGTGRRGTTVFVAALATGMTLAAGIGTANAAQRAPASAPATVPAGSTPVSYPTVSDPACTPYLAISAEMNKEQPDPTVIAPLLTTMESAAPAELADSFKVMIPAVQSVIASKGADMSAFASAQFDAAQGKVSTWMFDHCAFDARVEVTTKDFSFEGIPDTLKPGLTAFLITNVGPESHEMTLSMKNAGTTESFTDLLKLPEDQAMTKVTNIGSTQVPAVGSVSLLVVDLTPGSYAALCFMPMGTSVTADGTMTEGTGAPHAMSGMVKEFTVAP